MLVYTWLFIFLTCATTDAEERPPISKQQYTNKKNLNFQTVGLKLRSKSNKLTFQTLYPQFMSTWSSLKLNEKQRQVSQVIKKREDRRQSLSTKKVNRFNRPTSLKRNSIHNAFIEVETMRPYIPKRNTTSRTTSIRKITRTSQGKQMRNLSAPSSHKFPDSLKNRIKHRRILTPVPSSYLVHKPNSLKPKTFQSSNNTSIPLTNGRQVLNRLRQLDNDLKTIRSVVKNDTEVINHLKTEVLTSSAENTKSAESTKVVDDIKARTNFDSIIRNPFNNYLSKNGRSMNERLNRNRGKQNDETENKQDKHKVNQLRMEWLKQKLAGGINYRRNNKNFDDVNDKDEEKEVDNSMDEFNWNRNKTPNVMTNKNQTGIDKKHIDNNNTNINFINIDQITKDPLAYDSFDLELEHESNIQEIRRLKSKNALPTFKPHANKRYTTDKEEAKPNFPSLHNDNDRRDSLLFAPPPGFNKTNLESTKDKKNDQEVFNDVLEKILNGPVEPLNRDYVIDNTEALGKKMLNRLDLPGLKIDDTVLNKNFDHVKYVDSVMRQSSLPLSERRNIIKKSLDQRLNELYEKYNLKPKQTTKDDLDNVLKSIGATLHK